ncbi:hypothetical protein MKW98_023588 [Papaver atlanticum]|uniref:proline--tRNA ligase n=1 Tax=Papaver atlanticum TaxID=357466 RepID=A0AAD4SXA1_9MAGN|nr:hypothetical protein MKW98_023588 [Papaver atlanticum]
MQTFFDAEIKKMKIKNRYFPVFVSSTVLQKEKDHIEGFAPEVVWVTKSGDTDLEVPIAIRPTSETVMYPYFSKWIRGHRDLPLRLNQWCNVVRWEFSNPTPFIRSREYLWQEGHTAFATKDEADQEVLEVLELVEAFVPNTGRGVQGATSHCLGQNFAKMFEINFENVKGEKGTLSVLGGQFHRNDICVAGRIGVMVMVHGDDKGLVLPPKLNKAAFRVETDLRDNYSPGWKYSNWELKGIPLRIEIGPKDMAKNQVLVVRRDNGAKEDISRTNLVDHIKDLLENVLQSLFDAAKQKRDACVTAAKTWEDFSKALNEKMMILAPWCDEEEVERYVKTRTKGKMGACKTLCTSFDQPELPEGTLCFASGKPAKKWTYWGRNY